MSQGARYHYTREEVLEAIKGSGSVITTIGNRLGCKWGTARKYVQKWEETRQAWQDETESVLDMAESTLYTSIQNGNTQDAKWLLATKGKNRGFSERHEVTGADGRDIQITYHVVRPHADDDQGK